MKPISNIIFRADGDAQIGMGHLVRSLALAQMLSDEYDVAFVCRSAPDSFQADVHKLGFSFVKIEHEQAWTKALPLASIVVIDGYLFTTKLQEKLRSQGAILVCIDDLHDRPLAADLIINHAPGVRPHDYQALAHTQFALGPEYALLRSEFLVAAAQLRQVESLRNLLICFGGADPRNLSLSSLKTALEFDTFDKITLITGSAYQASHELSELIRQDARVVYRQSVDASEMLRLMQEADLGIVPASGMLMEALATKLPVISGMYTENQQWLYRHFKNAGAFEDAGDFSPSALKIAIGKILGKPISHHQVKLIDGLSGQRLRKLFSSLAIMNTFSLRKARIDDLAQTFSWASDERIRAYSFNKKITLKEHQAWFQQKIVSAQCFYLIAEDEDAKPMGSVRFDLSEGEVTISYLLDTSFHGQGLSTPLLSKAIAFLVEENTALHKINGLVMKDNIASQKAFQRLGFDQKEEKDYFRFEKILS